MRTIFVHHHAGDVLAAEVIGGALLSTAFVRLEAWPRSMDASPPDWSADHLVLWTPDAARCVELQGLLQGLGARRASCSLLLHAASPAPDHLIACPVWPLFDATTPWATYRRSLRSLFGIALPEAGRGIARPPITPEWLRRIEIRDVFPFTPGLIVAGILLLALMR